MKTQMSFLSSAARIFSLGFFCGLIIVPVSWLLFRSLALRYARSRGGSNLLPVPSAALRTERGLIVHVTPSTRDRASVLLTTEQEANKHICVSPTSSGEKLLAAYSDTKDVPVS